MQLALGLTVHTGWAACIAAGGSLRVPHIAMRARVEMLDDADRFVFHRAAETRRAEAVAFIERARRIAVERASGALEALRKGRDLCACAVVARRGSMPELETTLASHPKLHTAEGLFYRDVLIEAARSCGLTATIVPPSELDLDDPAVLTAGRLAGRPWNRDAKMAALAAWRALRARDP